MAALLTVLLLSGCGGQEALPAQEGDEADAREEFLDSLGAAAEEEADTLGSSVYSFQISVGGVIYTFPMMGKELQELGWEPVSSLDALGAHYFRQVTYRNGDGAELDFILYNKADSEVLLGNTIVEGYVYNAASDADRKLDVMFPGGFLPGVSTAEEMRPVYGEPTEETVTEDGLTLWRYEYSEHIYTEVSFRDGILENMTSSCIGAVPVGYSVSRLNVRGDEPEYVKDYKAPKAFEDDPFSYVYVLEGEYYRLRTPLKAFLENGWEIRERKSNDCAGNASSFITLFLQQGYETDPATGQEVPTGLLLDMTVYNEDGFIQPLENCLVEDLYLYDYGDSAEASGAGISASLEGGITLGMSADEVMRILTGMGVTPVTEESGSFLYYRVEDPENPKNGYLFCFGENGLASMEVLQTYGD